VITQSKNLAIINCVILFTLLSCSVNMSAKSDEVVNVYTSRHYDIDGLIYKNFTEETGIRVKEVSSKDQALLERLKNEGSNSPADILILADAARLYKAQSSGFFQTLNSVKLKIAIPDQFRSGDSWVGLTTRARIIVFNKERFSIDDVKTYEDLADKKFKNQFCSRTSSHPYMLSLISSLITNLGEKEAKAWAKKVVSNQARKPKGGDTDQMRAIASGECGVALTNSYYLVRLMRSKSPKDQRVINAIGYSMPNQLSFGTHINVTGGGILKNAPNPDNARRFLEYLASRNAQKIFAERNNEWPILEDLPIKNTALSSLGEFKRDRLSIELIGKNQFKAQSLADSVNWR